MDDKSKAEASARVTYYCTMGFASYISNTLLWTQSLTHKSKFILSSFCTKSYFYVALFQWFFFVTPAPSQEVKDISLLVMYKIFWGKKINLWTWKSVFMSFSVVNVLVNNRIITVCETDINKFLVLDWEEAGVKLKKTIFCRSRIISSN